MSEKDKALPAPDPVFGRDRLPNRRLKTGFEVLWTDAGGAEWRYRVDVGYRADGLGLPDGQAVMEVFATPAGPVRGTMKAIIEDAAVLLSLARQCQMTWGDIRRSLGRASPSKPGEPIAAPTSPAGAIADAAHAMGRALAYSHEENGGEILDGLAAALARGEPPLAALDRILRQTQDEGQEI